MFKKSLFYTFASKPDSLFYVLENKTLGGREHPGEGEAVGRKLILVFYQRVGDRNLVQPVDRDRLSPRLLTIAELLQACGLDDLPADPERSSAATEVLLEEKYLDLNILCFQGSLEAEQGLHAYSLGQGASAEAALLEDLTPSLRTKMVLARCLQRHGELAADETISAAWGLPRENLLARAEAFLPIAPPVPPAEGAGGRGGKGRGKGGEPRGRGRGKGGQPRGGGRGKGGQPRGRGRGKGR